MCRNKEELKENDLIKAELYLSRNKEELKVVSESES